MAVSLAPKDQVKAGLIADVDAVIKLMRFQTNIYKNGQPGVGAVAVLQLDGGDEERVIWSLGSEDDWSIENPEELQHDEGGGYLSGKGVDSVKGHNGTIESSNFSMLTRELIAAGMPETFLKSDISVLEGIKAHWIRKAQPKREGLQGGGGNQDRERTVLVPEKILHMPGEKAKGGAKAGTTVAKSTTTTAASSANDVENENAVPIAAAFVEMCKTDASQTLNKMKWGTLKLSKLPKVEGYPALAKADKDAVGRLLGNAEWLGEFGITLSSDGGVEISPA